MKNPKLRSFLILVSLITVIVSLVVVFLPGCSYYSDQSSLVNPPQTTNLGKLSVDNPQVQAVMSIQNRHTAELMKDKNVVGTATGMTDDGKPAVMILLENPIQTKGVRVTSALPKTIEGVPVIVEVVGKLKPMAVRDHQVKQTPPISLGTSGGWRYDLANGYCCGGTLGSLVQKGGSQYIMSNYHVFWGDIVAGGNSRVATAGDPVVQPGLIDVGCSAASAQNVGTLSGSGSLPNANVDVGLALVTPGMVRTDGAILEIGTLSASTVGASIGQAVKKSGRTTGLSRSTISGLNATVSIQYENECAGGNSFVKTFTGQIVVKNKGSKFLNSGDSGSLMVEDVTTRPRAVGLLFAGSSTTAIANPIGAVLSWAGATMVGQ